LREKGEEEEEEEEEEETNEPIMERTGRVKL